MIGEFNMKLLDFEQDKKVENFVHGSHNQTETRY